MNDERVEAAAKELHKYVCEEYDYGPWEKQSEDAKKLARESVSRILKAADAVSGERVVWTNPYAKPITVQVACLNEVVSLVNVTIEVPDGHELVVRKVRGT